MKKINVLLASSSGNLYSGASRSMIALAKYLISYGCQVMIVLPTKGDLEQKCLQEGLNCTVIKHYRAGWCRPITIKKNKLVFYSKECVKSGYDRLAYYKLRKLIRDNQIDIVHVNASTEYLTAKAAIAEGVKTVWHIREFLEEDLYKRFNNAERSYRLMDRADRVIAISQAVKNKYQKHLSKPIEVVYNGIDISKYYCEREILTEDNVRICIAGRISQAKGQDQLVDAVIRLHQSGIRSLKVQIIGKEQYKDYYSMLKKKVSESGCADMFEFISFTNEIETYYKNADVVCVCSKMEAFGRVTVEGMAAGAVVIGADTGGTTELIQHGETGLIYKEGRAESLAEQIEWVVHNKETAKTIAKKGQEWSFERFTADTNAKNILNVYRNILAEK